MLQNVTSNTHRHPPDRPSIFSTLTGDIIYRSAGKGALKWQDVLYHSAIRFATNAPYRTHHCTLYSSVNWSSLYTRRKTHTGWGLFIKPSQVSLPPIWDIYCSPHPPHTTPVLPVTLCSRFPKNTHSWVAPLFSLLQLATGTSCKKHSNWTVLSPSLHFKTQS